MAIIQKEFIQYTINYISHKKLISDKGYSIPEVNVQLFDNKFEIIGTIRFQDESPVDANFISVDNGIIIHYPISRFNDNINILRYEKP